VFDPHRPYQTSRKQGIFKPKGRGPILHHPHSNPPKNEGFKSLSQQLPSKLTSLGVASPPSAPRSTLPPDRSRQGPNGVYHGPVLSHPACGWQRRMLLKSQADGILARHTSIYKFKVNSAREESAVGVRTSCLLVVSIDCTHYSLGPPTSGETTVLNCSEVRCALIDHLYESLRRLHSSEIFTYCERFRASGYVTEAWTVSSLSVQRRPLGLL
jgi:hypothetical protein